MPRGLAPLSTLIATALIAGCQGPGTTSSPAASGALPTASEQPPEIPASSPSIPFPTASPKPGGGPSPSIEIPPPTS